MKRRIGIKKNKIESYLGFPRLFIRVPFTLQQWSGLLISSSKSKERKERKKEKRLKENSVRLPMRSIFKSFANVLNKVSPKTNGLPLAVEVEMNGAVVVLISLASVFPAIKRDHSV